MEEKRNFITCEKCGKLLIERQQNGLWHFVFGKQRDSDGNLSRRAPVDIIIYGSIKMKCFRWECRRQHPDHWNILNFFPFREDFKESLPDEENPA